MTPLAPDHAGDRLRIERAVRSRRAGDTDFIIAGIIAIAVAMFVIGFALGLSAGTWWLP